MPITIRKTWLLLAAFVAIAISTQAQNKVVTLKADNTPLSAVLASIEQQTGYTFVHSDNVNLSRPVDVDVTDTPTSKVLSIIFPKSANVSWDFKGTEITLKSKSKSKNNVGYGKRTVTGTVKDAKDGEPLAGAVVSIAGMPNTGTLVDVDGNFAIEVTGKKPVLQVNYIGYKTREVPVGDLTNVDIPMTGAENTFDEVIVVGSGTQKKVSVTGAISSVSGDALKMPTTTLSRALGGKIAGLITKQNSGEPGTGADFYIRGISTFGGKATPLILLDDVEINASDLNAIPAENIESFSVLKDASATAIYGARGANGVMIITTKGGDYNSKTKINIKVENTFNFLSKVPEFISAVPFMEFYNNANSFRNPNSAPLYSDVQIQRTKDKVNPYLYPDVDWRDELFRKNSQRQRVNLNVSGGGTRAKYYMSLDFQHENGIQKPDKWYSWDNRQKIYNYTFQNNISYKLTSSTVLALNINAQIQQTSRPNTESETTFGWIRFFANPVEFPVYYPTGDDGKPRYASKSVGTSGYLTNPKAEMNKSFFQRNRSVVNSVVKLDQGLDFITPGLKLNAWVNFKTAHRDYYTRTIDPYLYYYRVDDDTDPEAPFEPAILNPSANQYINQSGTHPTGNTTFELQGNLNWNRNFGLHDITAMVMYRMREYRSSDAALPNRNQGISGRFTYDYAHRYLAEFNFGYNGSERLTKKYRFGFFPAGSIGWVISNEEFWEPLSNAVSNLKLRASYGLVGSDDLASPNGTYYLYIDQIYNNNLNFWNWSTGDGDGSYTGSGPLIRYYALNNVTWEKSRKFDIGLDFTLFRDLHGSLEYFNEYRYDIFMERASWPYALDYGLAVPWANTGRARNQGFELSLNYNRRLTKDLSVSFQGNFTYTQNKYLDKDEPNYKYPWQRVTGTPLDGYRVEGYIAEGLFRSQEEIDMSPAQQVGTNIIRVGDIKYRDLNGDGKINSDDKTMISKYGSTPRIMYGFGATLNWKNWDFGFFFTGAGCRTISIAGTSDPQQNTWLQNENVFQWVYDDYFDPNKGNFDAAYPLPGVTSSDISNNTVNSTYWLRNASYLRLRELELGWTFKYGRVFASGNNLFVISGFKYWDPELNSPNVYPLQKSLNIGIQFNL